MNVGLAKTSLPPLYEINAELEELAYEYDNAETQDDINAVEQRLLAVEIAYKDKVTNIGLMIKNWFSYSEMIDTEIKVLQARKKSYERRAEWLKSYLQANVKEPIKLPNIEITFRKSEAIIVDPAINLEEQSKIHPDLIRVKTTYDVDKVAAKSQLKQTGVLPEFLKLETRSNIQIK